MNLIGHLKEQTGKILSSFEGSSFHLEARVIALRNNNFPGLKSLGLIKILNNDFEQCHTKHVHNLTQPQWNNASSITW